MYKEFGFVFSIIARIDEVVISRGELQAKGAERPIKAPFSSLIKGLYVEEGDKVKVNIMFFGRMMAHKDLGLVLMEKFENAIGEAGIVEQPVRNEGRSMFMIMAPPKKKQ